jgi:large subunit ribosomal protein L13
MKTKFLSVAEAEKNRKWVIVDAADKVVGRIASEVASVLRGKNNPKFTPHVDCGDFVIVINAGRAVLTGTKRETKEYHHHTGFVGNVKTIKAGKLLEKDPEELIRLAVAGMLPKNALAKNQLSKLKIYRGAEHKHEAQKPELLSV